MNKTAQMVLVVLVGLLLLAGAGCYGLVRVHQARQEARMVEFEDRARRLGFEPTFDGVAGYIKQSIKTGMTRNEVEHVLRDIAPLRVERGELEDVSSGWGPTACDEIQIDLSAVLTGGPVPIIACYDKEGRLVKMDFAEPDAPPLDIYAPSRE